MSRKKRDELWPIWILIADDIIDRLHQSPKMCLNLTKLIFFCLMFSMYTFNLISIQCQDNINDGDML